MEPDIDYKAVTEQLQRELENARLTILRLRQARSLHVDITSIKRFLLDNYMVISAVSLILFAVLSLFDTVKGLFTKRSKE